MAMGSAIVNDGQYTGQTPDLLHVRSDQTAFEQINNTTGTVTYLHHDQAGSTRLLTGSTGTVTGKCTYSAYGTSTCEGTTTTALGYDARYTSTDTGLIYLRARTYDPATGQFLSVDALGAVTRAPFNFAGDNPLNKSDRTGLGEETEMCFFGDCISIGGGGGGSSGLEAGKEILETNWREAEGGAKLIGEEVEHGAESIWNEVSGQGGAGHPVQPAYNPESWKKGPPSRAKEPEESYWDPEGGE